MKYSFRRKCSAFRKKNYDVIESENAKEKEAIAIRKILEIIK